MKTELFRPETLSLEKKKDISIVSKDIVGKKLDIALLDRPIMPHWQRRSEFPPICRATHLDSPIMLRQDIGDQPSSVRKCLNSDLEGMRHPKTGVLFERTTVCHKGEKFEVIVPRFESKCDVQLPEALYEAKNKTQFDYANEKLREQIKTDPVLQAQFNSEQLEQIRNGDRPDGYVWHHSEQPGQLQLVDKGVHDGTAHTGGQQFWGGGAANR